MITAIIPAAGSSRRMNSSINKQFMSIAGQPVLTRTLLSLVEVVDDFIIVARCGEEEQCRIAAQGIPKNCIIVTGGETRQESVFNGLMLAKGEFVLIHDGNRPLTSPKLIQRVVEAAKVHNAAIPAVPVVDTIKEISAGRVKSTLPRHLLQAVQTPQVFQRELLLRSYQYAIDSSIAGTDDASLVEAMGCPVAVVEGERTNIKITTPGDIERAEGILNLSKASGLPSVRTGIGYDVHRLVPGRRLILGGVNIPYAKGLLGHSDADVLVHAIMDAMLGAAALGDIGQHFPDTDQAWAGADSCNLLAHIARLLEEKGFRLVNIDAVVIAQSPKLSPYIPQIRENIARRVNLEPSAISVKATTTEGLGFIGRGEGIAAQSVCTVNIVRQED